MSGLLSEVLSAFLASPLFNENIVSKRNKVYALAAGKFDNCKREGTKEQPNFIVTNKAEKMTQATTADGSVGQIQLTNKLHLISFHLTGLKSSNRTQLPQRQR